MSKQARNLKGFTVAGIAIITSNEKNRAAEDINRLWARFYGENIVDLIPGKLGKEIYAVYSDYEGDHTKPYRLTIGCKVAGDAALPDGLSAVTVPDGAYAAFRAAGEQPKALIDIWMKIWKTSLSRTFKADYEVYGPRFFEEGVHEIMVYVGVK